MKMYEAVLLPGYTSREFMSFKLYLFDVLLLYSDPQHLKSLFVQVCQMPGWNKETDNWSQS